MSGSTGNSGIAGYVYPVNIHLPNCHCRNTAS